MPGGLFDRFFDILQAGAPVPERQVYNDWLGQQQAYLGLARQAQSQEDALSTEQAALARQQAEMGREIWNRYKTVYGPAEESLVREAMQGIPIQPTVDRAGQEVIQAFDKNVRMAQRDLARMGINPASPRFAALLGDFTTARAAAEAGARNEARNRAQAENWARRSYVVGLGKGLPSEAASMTASAGGGLQGAGTTIAQGLAGVGSAYGQLGGLYQSAMNNAAQRSAAAQDFTSQQALLKQRYGYENWLQQNQPTQGGFNILGIGANWTTKHDSPMPSYY